MDGHRVKRRRHNRQEYQQLEDDADSLRSSIARRSGNESRAILCDRCWKAHTRRRATKRCLNCKQNLCNYCAKIDSSRRRSWWPSLLINCWRFLFLKAFKRHTILDLAQLGGENDTNNGHFRNDSPRSSYSGRDERIESDPERQIKGPPEVDDHRHSEAKRNNTPRYGQRRYYCPNAQALYRAYSFDRNLNKKKKFGDPREQTLRRTRSAERLPNKDFVDRESEFQDLYHKNWEREPFDFHRAQVTKIANQNETTEGERKKSPENENARINEQPAAGSDNNERRFKRGKTSRRGIKHVADIFPENSNTKANTNFPNSPNAFPQERPSKHGLENDTRQSKYSDPSEKKKQHHEPTTAYIVEEPPDSCPVCLESIPCRQARQLSCSHTIHTCCLIDLLNKMEFDFGVKCPICNQITQIRNYYLARHLWYKELPVVTS